MKMLVLLWIIVFINFSSPGFVRPPKFRTWDSPLIGLDYLIQQKNFMDLLPKVKLELLKQIAYFC